MTREEHIELAKQAFIDRGFWPNGSMWECWRDAWIGGVAAERERCALVCNEIANSMFWLNDRKETAEDCAEAIRKGESVLKI